MEVTLDKRIAKTVAYLPGVQVSIAALATQIGMQASVLLDARHGKTDFRRHSLAPPRITVTRGKKLDWFVMLEAEGNSKDAAVSRAVGIEFGHREQSAADNSTGPWGESQGLGVLRDAVAYTAWMNDG